MKKRMFKAFAGKLLGIHGERAFQSLLACLILYGSLHTSGIRIPVAPRIRYLMISVCTAGVMWRALSSADNRACLKHLRMLPYEDRDFLFSWVAALGVYTLVIQTGPLFALLLAVSSWSRTELSGAVLCMVNAVGTVSCVYSWKCRHRGLLWGAFLLAGLFISEGTGLFFPLLAGNAVSAALLLFHADAEPFFLPEKHSGKLRKYRSRGSILQYLLRYLLLHPGYLVNTFVLWGIACVLPVLFLRMGGGFFLPMGFGILSVNTPPGILLSCDRDLERAVRTLPGQAKRFFLPYGCFLFLNQLLSYSIFLISCRLQSVRLRPEIVPAAFAFALLSSAGTAGLERFFPIRNWKIENDLWHHPRKYIVPAALLLLSGIVCTAGGV